MKTWRIYIINGRKFDTRAGALAYVRRNNIRGKYKICRQDICKKQRRFYVKQEAWYMRVLYYIIGRY